MKNTALIFLVMIAMLAVIPAQAARMNKSHMSFLLCVDLHATAAFHGGAKADAALEAGIGACSKELNRYVDSLVTSVKKKHRWSSVQPEVPKAIRAAVVESTIAMMRGGYRK